jgi:hypothetical protein
MIHFIKKVGGVLPNEEIQEDEHEETDESYELSNHSSAISVAHKRKLKAKLRTFGKKKPVTIPS